MTQKAPLNAQISFRRTGRTTRAVQQAVHRAANGEYVIFICATAKQITYVADLVVKTAQEDRIAVECVGGDKFYLQRAFPPHGAKVGDEIPQGQLSLLTLHSEDLRGFNHITGQHVNRNVKVVIDHEAARRAIMTSVPWAFEELMRRSNIEDI